MKQNNSTVPCSRDAEVGVIGSILLDSSRLDEVVGIVSAENFYIDANQRLYRHFVAMRDAGLGIDDVTLLKRLGDSGDMEKIGGIEYLGEIAHAVPSPARATHYATIVAEQARRRMMILAAAKMLEAAGDHTRPVDEIGLDSFDLEAGGLFNGELVISAARPSIGKTSMAMQISQHVAAKDQHVYFASLEMRNTELALRILCRCP